MTPCRPPALVLNRATEGSSSSVVPFATTIGNGTSVVVTWRVTRIESELGPAGFGSRLDVPWRVIWYSPGATPVATWIVDRTSSLALRGRASGPAGENRTATPPGAPLEDRRMLSAAGPKFVTRKGK